jgi:hypothetical protein
MNLEKELIEKVKLFEQIKNKLGELSKEIGAKTEEQRAVYNQGLELKGAIDVLVALKQKEDADLKASKTASLILPEGVKPVINTPIPAIPVDAPQVAIPGEKSTLEVV